MTRYQEIEQAAVAVVAAYDNDNCRLDAMGFNADEEGRSDPMDDLIYALSRPKRRQQKGTD